MTETKDQVVWNNDRNKGNETETLAPQTLSFTCTMYNVHVHVYACTERERELTLYAGEPVVPQVESCEVVLGTWSKSRHTFQLVEAQVHVGHTVYELSGGCRGRESGRDTYMNTCTVCNTRY